MSRHTQRRNDGHTHEWELSPDLDDWMGAEYYVCQLCGAKEIASPGDLLP